MVLKDYKRATLYLTSNAAMTVNSTVNIANPAGATFQVHQPSKIKFKFKKAQVNTNIKKNC